MADSRHFLNSEGLTYLWSKIKNYISANKGVGEDVSGQTFTVDETEVTAGVGAERFNDYTNNIATGNCSHAEGYQTKATGVSSHAEGYRTKATGLRSHAEGSVTTASGTISHAEGGATIASGMNSHAEGIGTIAASSYQHVQGRYNIEDANSTYAHIVGNGTSSTRANIHTLDWNGAAWYKGGVRVGGTSAADATELTPGIEKFTITATIDYEVEPPTCTMDKTYAEILAAYNSGDILEVINTDGDIFPLVCVYEDSGIWLIFANTAAQDVTSYGRNQVNSFGFVISPSGVSIENTVLPIPSKTSDLTNDAGFITSHQPVVQTLTSGTAIGSVGGTVLYAPSGGGSSSPEIYIGSTTPSGYTMWIDPDGMITDGNEVGY